MPGTSGTVPSARKQIAHNPPRGRKGLDAPPSASRFSALLFRIAPIPLVQTRELCTASLGARRSSVVLMSIGEALLSEAGAVNCFHYQTTSSAELRFLR